MFDFVADERNEPRYNPRMRHAEKISSGPIGPGTPFRAATTMMRRTTEMTIEITGYERPRRLTSSTQVSAMDINGALTFDVVVGVYERPSRTGVHPGYRRFGAWPTDHVHIAQGGPRFGFTEARGGRSPDGCARQPGKTGGTSRRTTEEDAMKAEAGDRLVVHAHHLGESERDAEILEVIGKDGGPPFRVRWSDDGHEGLFFPGGDASVEHLEHRVVKRARPKEHPPRQPA